MWADNVKFVKDIIDSKYQKIDAAVAEVNYKFIESITILVMVVTTLTE